MLRRNDIEARSKANSGPVQLLAQRREPTGRRVEPIGTDRAARDFANGAKSEFSKKSFEPSARSGLTFRNIFAKNAFVALQRPRPIRTVLKPLGDARLCMDLTVHHRNAGLIAVGDDLLQADLAVAQHGDESNEHRISINGADSAHFTMQRSCQLMAPPEIGSVRIRRKPPKPQEVGRVYFRHLTGLRSLPLGWHGGLAASCLRLYREAAVRMPVEIAADRPQVSSSMDAADIRDAPQNIFGRKREIAGELLQ
jgi:hypothetical protein